MRRVPLVKASCDAYECVMCNICTSPLTRTNESYHVHERSMSHIQMRNVTHMTTWFVSRMDGPWHTYKWVMSHIWMSHATQMNTSCHTYEWGMSPKWIRHVTHMNESCHTNEYVMSHIRMTSAVNHFTNLHLLSTFDMHMLICVTTISRLLTTIGLFCKRTL